MDRVKKREEMVLLLFQAAFPDALLIFLLFLAIIIRPMEVWVKRRRMPQGAILKHPKVLCFPFDWRFTLSNNKLQLTPKQDLQECDHIIIIITIITYDFNVGSYVPET